MIWASVGTWVLVVGTLIAMYRQTRQQEQSHSANAVMALRERYESLPFHYGRSQLARQLTAHEAPHRGPALDILRFFELMGFLSHRRVIDAHLVWSAF